MYVPHFDEVCGILKPFPGLQQMQSSETISKPSSHPICLYRTIYADMSEIFLQVMDFLRRNPEKRF